MVRGAVAMATLALLAASVQAQAAPAVDAAPPSAEVFLGMPEPLTESAASDGVDWADGCIGPKLTGDQMLIAKPYSGGGFVVFVGAPVGPLSDTLASAVGSWVTLDLATANTIDGGADGGSRDLWTGDDYVGAGAYVMGPGCEVANVLAAAAA